MGIGYHNPHGLGEADQTLREWCLILDHNEGASFPKTRSLEQKLNDILYVDMVYQYIPPYYIYVHICLGLQFQLRCQVYRYTQRSPLE